jgi:hypothetical protein
MTSKSWTELRQIRRRVTYRCAMTKPQVWLPDGDTSGKNTPVVICRNSSTQHRGFKPGLRRRIFGVKLWPDDGPWGRKRLSFFNLNKYSCVDQWFPTGVPRYPGVPPTLPRGTARCRNKNNNITPLINAKTETQQIINYFVPHATNT